MELIARVEKRVREHLKNAESGHDWLHIQRVLHNARQIAEYEDVELDVVEAAALLHDIADAKFHDGDETIAPALTREILSEEGAPQEMIEHVVAIVDNISFRKGSSYPSMEFKVVQDADRLDAIGAIGIARMFTYGGFKNRPLYDIDDIKNPISSLGHYYEKLITLNDTLHTKTAKLIAKNRQEIMTLYVDHFKRECGLE